MGRARTLYTVTVFIVLASLDNAAVAVLPPLYGVASVDLGIAESSLGVVTAATLLVTAASAVVWGYLGDRFNRRPLLIVGTLVWSGSIAGAGAATGFPSLLAAHVVAAIGLGSVASIGFSVVTDLVSPSRRGLAMSFWGLSQGVGTFLGQFGGGVLGAEDWRRPFFGLGILGAASALAYLFADETPRGASEPALQALAGRGEAYTYTVEAAGLRELARRRTNVWLIVQAFISQFAYGSLVWLPRLFQSKVEALGYPLETATVVGTVFASVFQIGGLLSILGGWIGDRRQRHDPGGRAFVSGVAILAGIPFYIALFFTPIRLDIPAGASAAEIIGTTLAGVVTEPTVAVTFVVAFLALTFTSVDSPNWFALVADVNLPEHRGTVFGLANFSLGVGRAIGNGLAGFSFPVLVGALPPPLNYAVGLTLFQGFFVPAGWSYLRAARTSPADIAEVNELLEERARGGDG